MEGTKPGGIRPGSFGNIPCRLFIRLVPPLDVAAPLDKWEGGAQFKTKTQFYDAIGKKGPVLIDADWDFWRMTGEAVVQCHNEETLEISFAGAGKLQFYPAGVEREFPDWRASKKRYYLFSKN